MPEVKSIPIDDANMVAFLVLKGFVAIPYISKESTGGDGSRVSWDVQEKEGIDLNAEIRKFNINEMVGVHDFVRILKDIRGQMYSTKQLHNQLRRAD